MNGNSKMLSRVKETHPKIFLLGYFHLWPDGDVEGEVLHEGGVVLPHGGHLHLLLIIALCTLVTNFVTGWILLLRELFCLFVTFKDFYHVFFWRYISFSNRSHIQFVFAKILPANFWKKMQILTCMMRKCPMQLASTR